MSEISGELVRLRERGFCVVGLGSGRPGAALGFFGRDPLENLSLVPTGDRSRQVKGLGEREVVVYPAPDGSARSASQIAHVRQPNSAAGCDLFGIDDLHLNLLSFGKLSVQSQVKLWHPWIVRIGFS